MRSAQSSEYVVRLDHLRFLAAVLVLLFHFFHLHIGDMRANNPLLSLVDEGHTSVGLFMVMSGFIFTLLAREREVAYWAFLRNRLIRIYPLFVFAVFLSLFISTYNEHRNYGFDALVGWLVPFRSDTVPMAKYFIQLWTIWVEFHFYLLFPFLLAFANRYGLRYLVGLIGLFVLMRLLVFAITGSVRFVAYETIFGRMDEFLFGMIAARLHLGHRAFGKNPLWLLVAGMLVIATVHVFDRVAGFTDLNHPVWVIWTTCEGAMWGLFVIAYINCRWTLPRLVEDWLARLGTISFSMYVMHNLVIAAIGPVAGSVTFSAKATVNAIAVGGLIVLPAVVAVSAATYFLIERPFLRYRTSYLRSEETHDGTRN
jgi:peptidoglycan/LPS O-acetylase OafA/YrhL